MAAFSYQYHPFLVDSAPFLPNVNTTAPPISHHHHQIFFHHDQENSNFDHVANDNDNSNNNNNNNQHEAVVSCVDQISSKASVSDNEPSVTKNNTVSPQSSMVVDNKPESGEQVTQKVAPPTDRKRRVTRHGSSLSNPQSKDAGEEKSKKMRKSNGNGGVKEEEEKKKGREEPPTGYIHVRARRGQATDSHSLAERVRREKISERMKMLQRLVPGCDKVTGKALMLDEIINYVQSLQNQVEFLSMKLASVNPMFYDLATDLDTLMVRPEKLNSITSASASAIVSVPHCSSPNNQGTNFADTTTMSAAAAAAAAAIPNASDHYLLDSSASIFVQGQRSNVFNEDTGSHFWDAEDQRQKFLHQYGFNNNSNLCSFH